MRVTYGSDRTGHTRLRGRLALALSLAPLVVASSIGCRHSEGPGGSAGPGSLEADRIEVKAGALSGWNVLLVSIDTLRADHLGCYGHSGIQTPVIDGLARRGVRFTQTTAPTPITLPSHASMLTGLRPPHHGARVNGMFKLDAKAKTLAEILASAGYQTAAIVSTTVLDCRYGLDRGFGQYDDELDRVGALTKSEHDQRPAGVTTAIAAEWLRHHGREKFFLFLHYFDPHFPYDPPQPFAARYASAPYDGEIAYVDQQLGALLNWLEENGLRARTLVVVTSDHGEGLGDHGEVDHGMLLHEATLHVPLIVSGCAPVPQGRVVTRLTGLVDIVPTVLALIGAPVPTGLDGVNLLEPPREEPRAIYIETLGSKFFRGWAPLLGVRRADYKFVMAPKPELYDLRRDPKELTNLYATEPRIAARLYALLRDMVGGDPELVTTVQANLPVTPEVQRQLEGLGYLVSSKQPTTDDAGQARKPFAHLPNPKDMVHYAQQIRTARADMARGDHAKAIAFFEPYVAKVPDDGRSLMFLGVCYDKQGRHDEALACFERALKLTGRDANIPATIGGAYLNLGMMDRAIACLERAIEINPRHMMALRVLGQAYRAGDRDAEAMAVFHRLAESPHRSDAAIGFYEIGQTHFARGRLDQAQQAFEQALKSAPSYVEASRALAAVNAKRADLAIERLRGVVATQPTAASLSSLGRYLRERGKAAEAVPLLERALHEDPGNAETHRQLGLALGSTGQTQTGIEHLRRAVQLDPNNAKTHHSLGTALGRAGRMGEALDCFNRAIELDPTSASAWYNAGLVLANQGQWAQAADKLREAVRLDPSILAAHLRLGQALEHLGQLDEAITCYNRVLQVEPEHKEARPLLERARRQLLSRPGSASPGQTSSPRPQ